MDSRKLLSRMIYAAFLGIEELSGRFVISVTRMGMHCPKTRESELPIPINAPLASSYCLSGWSICHKSQRNNSPDAHPAVHAAALFTRNSAWYPMAERT